MKKILALFLSLLMVLSFVACSGETIPPENTTDDTTNDNAIPDIDPVIPAGKTFYVSVNGNDANDGSKETPLATLDGAKAAVLAYKNESGLPEGGIEVIFTAGTYKVNSTATFGIDDSGEEGKPVVYKAEDGAEVIFDGGVTLNGADFVPASEDVKAKLLSEDAKSALMEIDLAAAGCYDFEERTSYGMGWGSDKYRQELYVDNVRQTLAQWPNGNAYETRCFVENNMVYLYIPEEKSQLWSTAENYEYYGAPIVDWDMRRIYNNYLSIDEEKNALFFDSSLVSEPHSSKSTLFVYNLIEELDVPGEYYCDYKAKKLYYYPAEDLADQKIVFSQYFDPFIVLDGAKYISYEGFTFENARAYVITGTNSENDHISVENCVLRCLGVNAINLNCSNAYISHNELYELGCGGILLEGGNLSTMELSNSTITNNHVYNYGQLYMVYQPGIKVSGLGFTISHNEVHNAPHFAISTDSGETVVEYNKVYDVCQRTSDAGAIYLGRRWDWGGNIFRFNYVYNIVDVVHGGSPNGIYLDDQVSDQYLYGNIFENIGGYPIVVCEGKYISVENNIFINCERKPITNDARGIGKGALGTDWVEYPVGYMWSQLLKTNPYSDIMRYMRPENLLILEAGESRIFNIDDPGVGSYLVFRGNVRYGCDVTREPADKYNQNWNPYADNPVYDGVAPGSIEDGLYGTTEGSICYPAGTDVGFIDAENGNYGLKDTSVIYRDVIGFKKIDFDKIGIERK